MHIRDFTKINVQRCLSKEGFNHTLESWSASDWMTALCGEVGEAANIIKKLNRIRDNIHQKSNKQDKKELEKELKKEIADIYCYLDLLTASLKIDLEEAIIEKFNEVSLRIGYEYLVVND